MVGLLEGYRDFKFKYIKINIDLVKLNLMFLCVEYYCL